jgi:branched-subunit amino acid aminotransferase/4-amino-4-deoxychorismate lyase
MAQVFLDGRFVERDDARVAAFDAGLQHGVGLFETMQARVSGGEAFVRRLDDHVRRMADSAAMLGLSESLRTEALAEAVVLTVERAGLERARVRLTITGGDLNLLSRARDEAGRGDGGGEPRPRGHNPTVLIDVQPATEYPAAMFERGVGVVIADARSNPFNPFEGHKTLNYWWRLRALQEAASKRVAEALVFSITNHLSGGCVSNAFLVRDGELWTPIARGEEVQAAGGGGDGSGGEATGAVLPSPVLPGITREEVIEAAVDLGVPVRRRMITAGDVLGAEEVFLTNSSWGVLPVVRVEAASIAGGKVGTLTRRLADRWQRGWAEAAL